MYRYDIDVDVNRRGTRYNYNCKYIVFRFVSFCFVSYLDEQVLESSEDSELIDLCLGSFKGAVRIAGGLDVPVRARLNAVFHAYSVRRGSINRCPFTPPYVLYCFLVGRYVCRAMIATCEYKAHSDDKSVLLRLC